MPRRRRRYWRLGRESWRGTRLVGGRPPRRARRHRIMPRRCGRPRGDRRARQRCARSRRCTSRTISRRSRRSPKLRRTCRRSPASTPRSTAASRTSRRPSRCRARSPTRACGATASTACPTNTSPASLAQICARRWRHSASSSPISATAPACARCSDGRSVASTMGFTAVDGLLMGTRCGAIDPGVMLYLMDDAGHGRARASRS